MDSTFKCCARCGQSLPVDFFHKLSRSKDGRRSECRFCRSDRRRKSVNLPVGHKKCPSCNEILSFDRFYTRGSLLHSWCAACENAKKESLRIAKAIVRKAEKEQMLRERIQAGEKPCSKCKEVKPFTSFYRTKHSLDGHSSACKACELKVKRTPDPEDAERPTLRRASLPTGTLNIRDA